jgi:predicted metal-binding membrane protein
MRAAHDHDATRSRYWTVVPARDMVIGWSLLIGLAALAWLLTVRQARGMDIEAGTMGLALPLFLVLWVIMMAAMMLPSVAPVAVTWAKAIGRQSSGWTRVSRTAQFIAGYLLAWAALGVLAYGGLALTGKLVGSYPGSGRWIGAAAFVLAGLYELGPLKYVCLRHCRDPMTHLMQYANFRPFARDMRVGVHHGMYCVGCCWALMVVLIPLGVMNVAAMAGLAAVIFVEKLWRLGPVFSRVVGVVLIGLGVLSLFTDWLLPGLQAATMPM